MHCWILVLLLRLFRLLFFRIVLPNFSLCLGSSTGIGMGSDLGIPRSMSSTGEAGDSREISCKESLSVSSEDFPVDKGDLGSVSTVKPGDRHARNFSISTVISGERSGVLEIWVYNLIYTSSQQLHMEIQLEASRCHYHAVGYFL